VKSTQLGGTPPWSLAWVLTGVFCCRLEAEPSLAQPERTAQPIANPARASKPLSDIRKQRPSLIRRQVRSDHRPAARPKPSRILSAFSALARVHASDPTAGKRVSGTVYGGSCP
jgi:hypothetical protein